MGRTDFSDQFRKVIIRHKHIGYNSFAGTGFCPVPGHVILTCKLHISGKIRKQIFNMFMSYNYSSLYV